MMPRPRILSDATTNRILRGKGSTSIAELAKRFGVSPRTMARYIQRDKIEAKTCPQCHVAGWIRSKKAEAREGRCETGKGDPR
jgi:hypothetical protein